MAAVEKPVFVFVPGAWHTADTFDGIRSLMAEQGLETEAIATPSVGASSPTTGLYADINHTKTILKRLVDNGRQVVVVAHSYGGIVGGSAVERLGFAQRSQAGLPGGIIMVVWMAAFVANKGQSLLDLLGGEWLPWQVFNNDGYCYSSDQSTVFYSDMTPEQQQKAIALLKPQPILSFTESALYEPWHDIPSMYLYCDKDQGLTLAVQEAFAKSLGNPVVFHTDGSHSAFLSRPVKVIEGLRLALKAGREQSGISSKL